MADLDGSIFFKNQAPDVIGSVNQGLSMGKAIADQQREGAVRDAYKNAVVQNPDGTSSLDQGKAMSALYQIDPTKAMEAQQQFTSMDKQKQDMQRVKSQMQLSVMGSLAKSVHDQTTHDAALQLGQQLGADISKEPKDYNPQYWAGIAAAAVPAEKQIENQYTSRGLDIKDKEANASIQANQLKAQELHVNKGNQTMKDVVGLLESNRGAPAVAQAEKDLYAAQKVKTLNDMYSDPNKMNNQMVNLLVQDVGKIASGGTPTQHELEGMQPNTWTGNMAKAWQSVSNNPTPANAAAFVKQYTDYSKNLASDARKVIQDKYGRVIESRKRALSPEDYQTLQDQYVNRFNAPAAATVSDADHAQAIQWAQANPNDPMAKQIMQINQARAAK